MTTYLVLTVIADDKPGLVESLAEVIARNDGNWLESSMSQLAGKFAGILRVSVADEFADRLADELKGLDKNLKLLIEKVQEEESAQSRTAKLTLVGNDHPGIIKQISHVLAGRRVNVEQLNTECIPAPMSGDMLFRANILLGVPADVELDSLQADLEQLADDLIVEIKISK